MTLDAGLRDGRYVEILALEIGSMGMDAIGISIKTFVCIAHWWCGSLWVSFATWDPLASETYPVPTLSFFLHS